MATMNAIHARERRPVCQREGHALRRFRRGELSFAGKKDFFREATIFDSTTSV